MRKLLFMFALLGLFATACSDDDEPNVLTPTEQSVQAIADKLTTINGNADFVAALRAVDVTTLSNTNFTVFGLVNPTAASSFATTQQSTASSSFNIKQYMLAKPYTLAELRNLTLVVTINGDSLVITKIGSLVYVNGVELKGQVDVDGNVIFKIETPLFVTPVNPSQVNLPKKIASTEDEYEFVYDAQKRLIGMLEKDVADNFTVTRAMSYTASNQIVVLSKYFNANNVLEEQYFVEYVINSSAKQVIATEYDIVNGIPVFSDKDTITINDAGRVTYFDGIVYEYSAAGNIIKETDRGSETLSFTYDDKKGIFSSINAPQWLLVELMDIEPFDRGYFMVNNLTKETSSEGGTPETYQYTYNTNNFPTAFTYTADRESAKNGLKFTVTYF